MAEYLGRGDPRRTMSLLWGRYEVPTRGPKHGLTVEQIVAAAIELADAEGPEGLAAVSMRKIGERFGKSAMSLYTYVPGKAELLDLMVNAVLAELPTEYSLDDGWRPALERCARDHWDLYQRHPWVLQVSGSRGALGPHEFDVYETQLRIVDGLGLDGVEMARVVGFFGNYVGGAAKAVSDARTAEQATGISDDDWWNARSPLLEELADEQVWAERYPVISRLDAEEHAFDQLDRDPDDETPYLVKDALDTFEFGLQRLLDGIEVYIESRRTPEE
jgi:AcrR family transcriptional regulator